MLSRLRVPHGGPVRFVVRNDGDLPHNFKIGGKATRVLNRGQKPDADREARCRPLPVPLHGPRSREARHEGNVLGRPDRGQARPEAAGPDRTRRALPLTDIGTFTQPVMLTSPPGLPERDLRAREARHHHPSRQRGSAEAAVPRLLGRASTTASKPARSGSLSRPTTCRAGASTSTTRTTRRTWSTSSSTEAAPANREIADPGTRPSRARGRQAVGEPQRRHAPVRPRRLPLRRDRRRRLRRRNRHRQPSRRVRADDRTT